MRKLLTVLVIGTVAFAAFILTRPRGPEPDVVYPMTNRGIEWRYAGK